MPETNQDHDYDGRGVCPACGGRMGRWRDEPWTGDRCHACKAAWAVSDRDRLRAWVRWE